MTINQETTIHTDDIVRIQGDPRSFRVEDATDTDFLYGYWEEDGICDMIDRRDVIEN